jgi:hypothetical protein
MMISYAPQRQPANESSRNWTWGGEVLRGGTPNASLPTVDFQFCKFCFIRKYMPLVRGLSCWAHVQKIITLELSNPSRPQSGGWSYLAQCIKITIMDIIHRPVLYLKYYILETRFCLRLHVERTHLGSIDRSSLSPNRTQLSRFHLKTETESSVWKAVF